MYDVIDVKGGMPEWFVAGVEAALKAPTAVNQQKFVFMLEERRAVSESQRALAHT